MRSRIPYFLTAACLAVSLAAVPSAEAKRVRPEVKVIEFYGSSKVKPEVVREKFKKEIDRLMFTHWRKSTRSSKEAKKYRRAISQGVKALGDFGLLKMHIVKLAQTDDEKPILILFEVVEKKDMATRLPFRSFPTGEFDDTSQLTEAWAQYEALGEKLEAAQLIERPDCSAFYCVWGSLTPELAELERKFVAEVFTHKDLLVRIMQEHESASARKAAVYLLSYLKDGASVSNHAAFALMDADNGVRRAGVDVLSDLTIYYSEVPIAIHQINRLLDVPFPEDRSRALALLLNLADNPDYRRFMIETASKSLLKILRISHPNNHNLAYTVLSLLSGETIPRRDYDAWDRWHWKATNEPKTKE